MTTGAKFLKALEQAPLARQFNERLDALEKSTGEHYSNYRNYTEYRKAKTELWALDCECRTTKPGFSSDEEIAEEEIDAAMCRNRTQWSQTIN